MEWKECTDCAEGYAFKDDERRYCHLITEMPGYGPSTNPDIYYPCYKSCATCTKFSTSDSNHKCKTCNSDFPYMSKKNDNLNCWKKCDLSTFKVIEETKECVSEWTGNFAFEIVKLSECVRECTNLYPLEVPKSKHCYDECPFDSPNKIPDEN